MTQAEAAHDAALARDDYHMGGRCPKQLAAAVGGQDKHGLVSTIQAEAHAGITDGSGLVACHPDFTEAG